MGQEMMDKTCRGFAEALAARRFPAVAARAPLWARWAPRCAEWLPATVRPIPRLPIERTIWRTRLPRRMSWHRNLWTWSPRTFVPTGRCLRRTVFRARIRLDRLRFRMRCTWRLCHRIALWMPAGQRVAPAAVRRGLWRRVLPRRHAGRESDALCQYHVYERPSTRRGARGGVR